MDYVRLWYPEQMTATETLHKLWNGWLTQQEMDRAHGFVGTEDEAIKLIRELEATCSGSLALWRQSQ